MKKVLGFIFRLISLPFMFCLMVVAFAWQLLKGVYYYTIYGGELNIYDEKKIMIRDVYDKVKELVEEKNDNRRVAFGAASTSPKNCPKCTPIDTGKLPDINIFNKDTLCQDCGFVIQKHSKNIEEND